MADILTCRTTDVVFEPDAITAMSAALDNVCRALKIPSSSDRERAVIAERIVELARAGDFDASHICETVLKEAASTA